MASTSTTLSKCVFLCGENCEATRSEGGRGGAALFYGKHKRCLIQVCACVAGEREGARSEGGCGSATLTLLRCYPPISLCRPAKTGSSHGQCVTYGMWRTMLCLSLCLPCAGQPRRAAVTC